ncbi:MAG: helix-turn-helix transcriptional regulator [Flavobacterium sp. JAD_PAG50586_2]|nr:MAG: helix-turn-helix transcriptional regulator [Flavobacterium sp. JAD_PAG50586_2]
MMHYILAKFTAKRLEKGYSQEYMASCLKITQGYYNKLENGKIEMTIRTMFKIMEILEMDTAELFGNSKAPENQKNHN